MKKLATALLLSIFALSAFFAERYQISDVNYQITGMTRKYALEKAVDIDKDRIFESFEEFHEYIENLKQQFQNERNLSSAILNVSYDPVIDEEGITHTTLNVITQDSKHLLILPYPKYNSNDGFKLKLKAKDTNFLGTLEPLNFDLNFAIEQEDESDDPNFVFGINFDYDYPFRLWKLDSSWNNSFSLDYTIGKDKPEFGWTTGFTFSLPFKTYALKFDVSQSITRDFDYTEFDDELYYTELFKISLPITIADLGSYGTVKWSPEVAYTWNWDKNGINKTNEDLSGPKLTVGQTITAGRINWHGNFRQGIDMSFTEAVGYNYQLKHYVGTIDGTIEAFKAFSWVGINSRFRGFTNLNETNKIGDSLRGIRDDQTYKGTNIKALRTKAAIIGSIDIPIKVIRTNWIGWSDSLFGEDSWFTNHIRFMRYIDFEMHFSPFVDFALTNNVITGKTFAIKDGWYAGGFEFLVYPAKWRSLVVRASAGVDVGRKVVKKVVSKLIDSSWRRNCSAYEIYIGIGYQY